MLKTLLIFLLGSLSFQNVKAQNSKSSDTLFYFMKNNGRSVMTKDSADYFLVIMPAGSSSGQKLYPVNEYYPDGHTPRMMATSLTNKYDGLKLEGSCITFFSNGKRKSITNFHNDQATGDVSLYYPNGKFYAVERYSKPDQLLLIECRDSTGKVLAENGNGKWLKYDSYITKETEEGPVKDSLEEGEWPETFYTKLNYVTTYHKGIVISSTDPDRPLGEPVFSIVERAPRFHVENYSFGQFLAHNIIYPASARENNIQGRVVISFVIEKDGGVSNAKVVRGPGGGLNEEALRVIMLSKWNPGMQNGVPVRCYYSVPISFSLAGNE
jgi:TonB family protein